jgi:hypothetical protein
MLSNWFRGFGRAGVAAVAVLLAAGPLFGQATTGKIQGRVTDAATGQPIEGAQITVDGTTLGNLTNNEGFYFINEVPAGLQAVTAQFIGYRAEKVVDERILAGQTSTLNFQLQQTAVELEALVVEGERNPLVPRDQTATKSIVRGESVELLPILNTTQIVALQPGVVQTNQGQSFRGARPNEEAVLIDGALTRSYGTGNANPVLLPVNSLEQVDVTVGAFSAEFGESQSGLVSYVTRSGGPNYSGMVQFQTDQLSPSDWRTNYNRVEANFGGPIVGPLSFFLAGTWTGNQYFSRNNNATPVFGASGVDVCPEGAAQFATVCTPGQPAVFDLDRLSSAGGANDVVSVPAPNFVEWDNGSTFPYNSNNQYLFTGNLTYQFSRGSRINFGYTRNRTQTWGRGGSGINPTSLYRFDNQDGTQFTTNTATLGAYFVITQSATSQLALDVRGSYYYGNLKVGILDPQWALDNNTPGLGLTSPFSGMDFLINEDNFQPFGFNVFDPDDDFINVVRSNAVPAESLQFYPSRNDLAANQSLPGLPVNLRSNPWAWRTSFNITGVGNGGLQDQREKNWQGRATIDWQLGRFNRLRGGGEYLNINVSNTNIPLFTGATLPETANPIRAGAFVEDRIDVGDLVLDFGIRWDYLDPRVEYPRTPGFVFNVPENLQAGFVRLNDSTARAAGGPAFVPKFGDDPCGNLVPDNECQSNFIQGETKSEFSPRLGVSFPVTPTSTFRLSAGKFVQTPSFFTGSVATQIGLLRNTNNDLRSGLSNTNTTFARDVQMPSTTLYEFGYRQLIGSSFVIDLSAFNRKQNNNLTFRKLSFDDPTNPGQPFFINVATNSDFTETNGFEVKLDWAAGSLFQTSVAYTFLDAVGTGSDPFTFTALVLRGVSNLATITGEPEKPPEVLLPLESSRKHNIAITGGLTFPRDYGQGSVGGAILRNTGLWFVFATQSGLPYTKLLNQGLGQIGPPSRAGLNGVLDGSISALQTGWTTTFDLSGSKGFYLGGLNVEAFFDWFNPLNIATTNIAFLETGNEVNELYRTTFLANTLQDATLDGDTQVRTFDIATESPDNDFNKFMLMRTEQRFGNGDGVFTVEEQERAFGQVYDVQFGVDDRFTISNQQLQLGLRLRF